MPKFTINFPHIEAELIDWMDLDDAADEIKKSVSCLFLYKNQDRRHEMLFPGFNEDLPGPVPVAMET